jgi:predicted DsbA family dithiol-disulfide isomerase
MESASSSRHVEPAGLLIDLYSDIACPWCFIGTWRIEAVIAGLPRPERVQLIHRPFIIDETIPPQGFNIHELFKKRYGRIPDGSPAEQEARLSNVPFVFARQTHAYPMVKAQTLLRHAIERGTQRALAKAFFEGYFVEGIKMADTAALASIAIRHGFSEAEAIRILEDEREVQRTRDEVQRARKLGVNSVPTFVFNGRFTIPGCVREEVLLTAIAEALDAGGASDAAARSKVG